MIKIVTLSLLMIFIMGTMGGGCQKQQKALGHSPSPISDQVFSSDKPIVRQEAAASTEEHVEHIRQLEQSLHQWMEDAGGKLNKLREKLTGPFVSGAMERNLSQVMWLIESVHSIEAIDAVSSYEELQRMSKRNRDVALEIPGKLTNLEGEMGTLKMYLEQLEELIQMLNRERVYVALGLLLQEGKSVFEVNLRGATQVKPEPWAKEAMDRMMADDGPFVHQLNQLAQAANSIHTTIMPSLGAARDQIEAIRRKVAPASWANYEYCARKESQAYAKALAERRQKKLEEGDAIKACSNAYYKEIVSTYVAASMVVASLSHLDKATQLKNLEAFEKDWRESKARFIAGISDDLKDNPVIVKLISKIAEYDAVFANWRRAIEEGA